MKVFGNKLKKLLGYPINYLFELFTGLGDEPNTYWVSIENKGMKIRKLKPGQSMSVMEAWYRICNPITKKDRMILAGIDKYKTKKTRSGFKSSRRLYEEN